MTTQQDIDNYTAQVSAQTSARIENITNLEVEVAALTREVAKYKELAFNWTPEIKISVLPSRSAVGKFGLLIESRVNGKVYSHEVSPAKVDYWGSDISGLLHEVVSTLTFDVYADALARHVAGSFESAVRNAQNLNAQ